MTGLLPIKLRRTTALAERSPAARNRRPDALFEQRAEPNQTISRIATATHMMPAVP